MHGTIYGYQLGLPIREKTEPLIEIKKNLIPIKPYDSVLPYAQSDLSLSQNRICVLCCCVALPRLLAHSSEAPQIWCSNPCMWKQSRANGACSKESYSISPAILLNQTTLYFGELYAPLDYEIPLLNKYTLHVIAIVLISPRPISILIRNRIWFLCLCVTISQPLAYGSAAPQNWRSNPNICELLRASDP